MMSVVGLPVRLFELAGAYYENVFATHYAKAPLETLWRRITP
jgi:hypothetical protein